MERLQKIIARAGVCSRRRAEELIAAGQVQVDGQVVTSMGVKVDPAIQKIMVQGQSLSQPAEKIYLLLHKPVGYVTTLHDPQGRPIVTDLLPGITTRVFPVGRLDYDSSGALLLTNDGALAQRVQHPSFEIPKTYEAKVKGIPTAKSMRQLAQGVMVDGRQTAPAQVRLKKKMGRLALLEITIHEGRNRQVRKMCAAVGHPVVSLCRLAYGSLRLAALPEGRFRQLSSGDISRVFAVKKRLSPPKKNLGKPRPRRSTQK